MKKDVHSTGKSLKRDNATYMRPFRATKSSRTKQQPPVSISEEDFSPESDWIKVHLNVNLKNLRAKIGDNPRNPKWLHTVHGVGYRFEDPTKSGVQ